VAIFFILLFYLEFFLIVNIDATAERIRQIHCAIGGTSGISDATNNVALAKGPIDPPESDVNMASI
jgi:hypothetical protein